MQIVVDNLLVSYESIGSGEKVILFLHGWQRSLKDWLSYARLLEKDYRVIVLDLPGFGASIRPEGTFSIFDYAEFVGHFLEKLSIKSCVLVGHSFGGRIGVIMAAESSYVSKLILVDSGGIEKKTLKSWLWLGLAKTAAFFVPQPIRNGLREKVGSTDYKQAAGMRDIFVKVVNQDLTHLFSKIKIPTLIIWGELDAVLPFAQAKVFKKGIVGSQLRVIWATGHDPHLESPAEFTEALTDFL